MTVVTDSSPLIILAKLGYFDLLSRIFPRIHISAEVHREVVVSGSGLPGAAEVEAAKWIEVSPLQNAAALPVMQEKYAMGSGELSAILLAKEIQANTVLLDDHRARKLAKAENLQVLGTVGLVEMFYVRRFIPDLRDAFRQLGERSFVDRRLLDHRLRFLGIAPLEIF